MKALSIKQPWAHAILHFGKDIENRTRKTNHRGPFLIHVGQNSDYAAFDTLREMGFAEYPKALHTGVIIGRYSISDCVMESRPRWFGGPYGYVLGTCVSMWKGRGIEDMPIAYEHPIPCKGQLGFFTPSDEVLKAVAMGNGDRAVWPLCGACGLPLDDKDDEREYHPGCREAVCE